VPEFLDTWDVEREALLKALEHFQTVFERFQERRDLDPEGADVSESLIASELAIVRNELMSATFTVGLFGLIKRGKSTLLNALVGREVSAMHVTPETAVPVYVTYADEPGAVVHFADGQRKHVAVEDVAQYTSQKHNPSNGLGVTHVEQHVRVGFLSNGTRLIDTPGLDDAEADEVYTERTMQELDVVDAGVVVFLSPPTVGATEMSFLTEVVSRDLKKSFLICNMYPQHFHDKTTRQEVLNYVGRRILQASRAAGMSGEVRVYPVCALEAWQARLDDDITAWKRSGADRLLRELELYLSQVAARDVLESGVSRIEKAAEMAIAEVRVRQQLLEDPRQLAMVRERVDDNIRELEAQFASAVDRALTEVAPLKMRIRGLITTPFGKAKRSIEDLSTIREVEEFASRFRREVEVAGELASRQFAGGFRRIVEKLRTELQQQLNAVMSDVVPNLPEINLSTSALLVTPDQLERMRSSERRAKQTTRSGAIAGGLAGGGGAFLAAGAGLLGPIGLVGGALVGWKLSSLIASQRNLDRAKVTLLERIDEIADRLARDFDQQVAEAVDTVRVAVDRRRRAFASDLYEQFDLVQQIGDDPALLERRRQDAERFVQAFEACAARARRALPD
jgi:hypothetical protein